MAHSESQALERAGNRAPVQPRSGVKPLEDGTQSLNFVRITAKRNHFAPLTFLIFVLVPAVAAGYFFFSMASDQYETHARMVVRTIGISASQEDDIAMVSMLSGGALVQDAHVFANYLDSPEIVKDLEAKVKLRALFSKDEIDPLSRLKPKATDEEVYDYWRGQSSSYVDGPSGIIEFSVRAFSKEDALIVAQAALESASDTVESLADEAKQDLLERAQVELDKALVVYIDSLEALRNYQNEKGFFNPKADAAIALNLITGLILTKLEAEAQLAELIVSGARESPVITKLENEIAVLAQQIDDQRRQMAGARVDDGELSEIFAKVIELETRRLLAENLYKSANRNFDVAKSNTQRQSTFVAVFAPPVEPKASTYPRRFPFWLIFVTACLALWATIVLTWAAVEDHRK